MRVPVGTVIADADSGEVIADLAAIGALKRCDAVLSGFLGSPRMNFLRCTLALESGQKVEVWYPAVPGTTGTDTYDVRDYTPPAIKALLTGDAPAAYSYSAGRDAAFADGAFPVVLFSHGFTGIRVQSSFLTSHLASWGMVVVAPEHPSRDLAWLRTLLVDVPLRSGLTPAVVLGPALQWLLGWSALPMLVLLGILARGRTKAAPSEEDDAAGV